MHASWVEILVAVMSVGLFIYLFYALIRAEKF
ncbi:K(+)-transporting ATPase subunit F [Kerstersia similis]